MAIRFGRYNDTYKPKEKLYYWKEALKLYEQDKHFDAYIMLCNYLKDDTYDNIDFANDEKELKFDLIQGSKIIHGNVNKKNINVICYLCKYEKSLVSFMRRLMELNYTLNYCRFALYKNLICLKFESGTMNGSPKKLYYAMKELATVADKQDDIFLSKFKALKEYDTAGIEKIPLKEKKVKAKYYHKWIDEVLNRISSMNQDLYSGGISYLLLNLLYKIDYLISPEGELLIELEKINYIFYGKSEKNDVEKNRLMAEKFLKLKEKTDKELFNYLYRTISTFGILNPTKHETVSDLINTSLKNTQWYCDNNFPDIALTILEFIASKSLFAYGLPKPTRELFHLQLNIMNEEFFHELGFKEDYYNPGTEKFNRKQIRNRIKVIIEENKEQFPDIDFDTSKLKFDSLFIFLESFLEQIKNLKLA
jgi:hypothetical protein